MTTWQEEKEEEARTLRDMAKAVLPHLTGTWTMKDKVNLDGVVLGVMLTGSDGQEIDFRVPWNKPDRIEISGGFGNGLAQHLSYREDREKTSITVAAGKDPKRIAADIEKRLLPGYIRELKKAKERKQSADEYAANQRNVLERIQAAVGGGHIPDHTKETLYCSNFHGLTVKYYSGYDVRIEMNLPVEMLIEVIEFIKEKSKKEVEYGKRMDNRS